MIHFDFHKVIPFILAGCGIAVMGIWIYVQGNALKQQRQENAALLASNVSLKVSIDTRAYAEKLAWDAAARSAARAQKMQSALEEFKEGQSCDPTDPKCGIDFINRILRQAGAAD